MDGKPLAVLPRFGFAVLSGSFRLTSTKTKTPSDKPWTRLHSILPFFQSCKAQTSVRSSVRPQCVLVPGQRKPTKQTEVSTPFFFCNERDSRPRHPKEQNAAKMRSPEICRESTRYHLRTDGNILRGLSGGHFRSIALRAMQTTCAYHCEHIQLESQLLVETDSTIAGIDRKVGYAKPSAFAEAFWRNKGYTPSQFRKQR